MVHMEQEKEDRWREAVAETLRAERAIAGLNQVQISEVTGIARTSYRLYEQAKRNPDAVQLASIAEALGIPFSHLLSEIERRAHR